MGATQQWHIKAKGPHTVRVQHAVHSGRVLLYVDDRRILDRRDGEAIWDAGFEYEFEIEGIPCKLQVSGDCRLWVNGRVHYSSG